MERASCKAERCADAVGRAVGSPRKRTAEEIVMHRWSGSLHMGTPYPITVGTGVREREGYRLYRGVSWEVSAEKEEEI